MHTYVYVHVYLSIYRSVYLHIDAYMRAVLSPLCLYLEGGPKRHEYNHYVVSSKEEERAKGRAEGAASKGADFVFTSMYFSHVGFAMSCSPSRPAMMVAEF